MPLLAATGQGGGGDRAAPHRAVLRRRAVPHRPVRRGAGVCPVGVAQGGTDPAPLYRALCANPAAWPAAVVGLGECGVRKDADRSGRCSDPDDARAPGPLGARLRGGGPAGAGGAVRVDDVRPLLGDPSAAVVRQATAALPPWADRRGCCADSWPRTIRAASGSRRSCCCGRPGCTPGLTTGSELLRRTGTRAHRASGWHRCLGAAPAGIYRGLACRRPDAVRVMGAPCPAGSDTLHQGRSPCPVRTR